MKLHIAEEWESNDREIQYRQWEKQYEQASRSYAVCKLVKQFGPQEVHPDVAPILQLHDRLTSVANNLTLA